MTRRVRALAVLVVLVAWLAVPVPSADAGEPGGAAAEPASTGRLLLLGQSAPVPPGGRFAVSVNTTGAPGASTVVARVHRPVNGRIQMDASITGERLGSVVHTTPAVPVAEGQASVRIDLGAAPDGIGLQREGVYPMSLTALDADGTEVATTTTHLVVLPPSTDTSPPLLVAVVVPLGDTPSLQPDGGVALRAETLEAMGSAAAALAAHAEVAVTLRVVPETLRALELSETAEDRAVLDELAAARSGRPLLSASFVRADDGAWLADGLAEDLAQQHAVGRSLLERVLGGPFDDGTAIVDDTTSEAALDALVARGVRRVVPLEGWVPDEALPEGGLAGPARLEGVSSVLAAVPDPVLHDHLGIGDDPVLAAHRAIAELMVRYFELPGSERGEVLAVPNDLAGSPGFLDALLVGLDRNPRLAAVSVIDLVDALPPDDDAAAIEPSIPAAGSTAGLPEDLAAAADATAAYRSLRGEGASTDLLDELLLVAGSDDLDPAERSSYLEASATLLEQEADGLTTPDGQTVTLTAQRADIPIVVENALDHEVRVLLRFDSEKLDFPDGGEQLVTLERGVNRLEVSVSSRATGAFPLRVEMLTPVGDVPLSSARMSIRSTAISGVGLVLSIGAGLFLLLWWGRHWRDARRSRRLVSPTHPAVSEHASPQVAAARRLLDDPTHDEGSPT